MFTRSGWKYLLILVVLLNSACTSLPEIAQRESSMAFSASPETSLGRLFSAYIREHPTLSGVQVLDTGREALQMRLALLEMAEQAIDLQYYIWNSDYSGQLLVERLLDAADRGVRVRLLLDDFNVNERDAPLVAMDAHTNIEVRVYNPNANRKGLAKWLALLGNFGRLNQRMHNKSFVVDGSAAIIGGRNIGDEYFDLAEEFNLRDRDLFAVGPVVGEVSQGFDTYWNSQRSYPVKAITSDNPGLPEIASLRSNLHAYIRNHADPEYALPMDPDTSLSILASWLPKLIWAEVTTLFDQVRSPEETDIEKRKQLAQRLTNIAEQTQSEVLIESAYLILGDEGANLLKELTGRGVRVRALTNSLASNDLTTNHAGYARRRQQMLENGIELYEFRPDALSCQRLLGAPSHCDEDATFGLHAKSMVFDRAIVFVGSFNLNLRSVYVNSENGLVVYSPELARRIAEDIEENMRLENSWRVELDESGNPSWISQEKGKQVRYSREPATGFWRRFKSGLISLFPVEKYL